MKNILCFGDSNTYGFVPGVGMRATTAATRWTGRLAKALGSDYYVIEEGLNGRTNAFDDPVDFDDTKNGKKAFPTILNTHIPLDLVIIMLGSNDLKLRFNATAYDIAKCQARLGEMARRITGEKNFDKKPAEILLVSPIHVGPGMKDTSPFRFEFGSVPSPCLTNLPTASPILQNRAASISSTPQAPHPLRPSTAFT